MDSTYHNTPRPEPVDVPNKTGEVIAPVNRIEYMRDVLERNIDRIGANIVFREAPPPPLPNANVTSVNQSLLVRLERIRDRLDAVVAQSDDIVAATNA